MLDISPSPDAKGSIREIILPKGLDLDRPKRTRTSFTAEQLYRLEMEFQRCQYVVGRERTELATTGISGFLLGWPWEAQSSPRAARESWGLRSSHCRVLSEEGNSACLSRCLRGPLP